MTCLEKKDYTCLTFLCLVEFVIKRSEENGGTVTFKDYSSLEQAFANMVNVNDIFFLVWFLGDFCPSIVTKITNLLTSGEIMNYVRFRSKDFQNSRT